MKTYIRPCVVLFGLLTILTGVIYPAIITVIGQVVFPVQANGSVIFKDGKAIGSSLVGQSFDSPEYFWGRPSATAPFAYNGASSGGSNLSPTNPAWLDTVKERVEAIYAAHPDETAAVPVDLVTASGSGLDPHISPSAAEFQVKRIAKARGLDESKVRELVTRNTDRRVFGIMGEPRVNVLRLNLALDAIESK